MELNKIYCGDALQVLKGFPAESVNMVMTSPPYWGLRDYGIEGQLGLEKTFTEYINKLCNIFDEVKRVLRKDGTCWVNLGDTYGGSWQNYGARNNKQRSKNTRSFNRPGNPSQMIPPSAYYTQKSLLLIPQRFAIEIINRGWILRNVIIWYKRNCMPSSVKDRFTVDFEYIYFFVKSKKYWFEQQYEPQSLNTHARYSKDVEAGIKPLPVAKPESKELNRPGYKNWREGTPKSFLPQGKNKRCVWDITTRGYKEAHFATYPEELCITPIKAGCPPGGVVLDPFCGAGTTCLVAKKLGRDYIGIELNQQYAEMARARIQKEAGLL